MSLVSAIESLPEENIPRCKPLATGSRPRALIRMNDRTVLRAAMEKLAQPLLEVILCAMWKR